MQLVPLRDGYDKKREAKAMEYFKLLDADKDGKVTADEVRANPAALKKLHPTVGAAAVQVECSLPMR
jgi:Ca2+-binding EF-hand superfamily protein